MSNIQNQELFQISETEINGTLTKTVNARDLHSFLESKHDFSTWIKNRIEKYDFIENQDFCAFHKKMEQVSGAKYMIEYAVTVDMAKELSMVENNEQGRLARRYFIECEKKLKEVRQEPPKPVEPPPSPGSAEDKIRAIKFVIDEMKLSTVAKQCLLLTTAETVTGVPIPYRPAIERKTYSAKEIGEMLGVSGNKIGRIANSHNLKIDKYGQFYLSKSESSDKQVETFRSLHEGRSAFMLLDFEEIIPVIKAILEED